MSEVCPINEWLKSGEDLVLHHEGTAREHGAVLEQLGAQRYLQLLGKLSWPDIYGNLSESLESVPNVSESRGDKLEVIADLRMKCRIVLSLVDELPLDVVVGQILPEREIASVIWIGEERSKGRWRKTHASDIGECTTYGRGHDQVEFRRENVSDMKRILVENEWPINIVSQSGVRRRGWLSSPIRATVEHGRMKRVDLLCVSVRRQDADNMELHQTLGKGDVVMARPAERSRSPGGGDRP